MNQQKLIIAVVFVISLGLMTACGSSNKTNSPPLDEVEIGSWDNSSWDNATWSE